MPGAHQTPVPAALHELQTTLLGSSASWERDEKYIPCSLKAELPLGQNSSNFPLHFSIFFCMTLYTCWWFSHLMSESIVCLRDYS